MVLTIQNQLSSPRSYLSGAVTVAANGNYTATSSQIFSLSSDSGLISDCIIGNVYLTDSVTIYASGDAIKYLNQIASSLGIPDKATFTYGSTVQQAIGGVYQDTSPSVSAGQTGALRMTTNRALHSNLRDSNGNEPSSTNPLPVRLTDGTSFISSTTNLGNHYVNNALIQNVSLAPNNQSTTNLAASASFTGLSDTTLGVAAIQVNIIADQPITAHVQQSQDGTNWDIDDVYFLQANSADSRTFQATASFTRVILTNTGVSTTTYLRLQTALCPIVETLPRALTESGNLKTAINEMSPFGPNATQLFDDTYDTGLDTINRWNTPVVGGGGVAASNTPGNIAIGTGTTANGYSYLTSQFTFIQRAPGWVMQMNAINLEFPLNTNTYRFWGFGNPNATPTAAAPLSNAIGWEVSTAGKLFAVCYSGGTRNVIADLSISTGNKSQPTDNVVHKYFLWFRGDLSYWAIDETDNVIATMLTGSPGPIVNSLPIVMLAVAGSIAPSSSGVLNTNALFVGDTTQSAIRISDGTFGWRKATVDSSGSLITGSQDKSGSGTISALNGAVTITSNGASTIFFNITGTWSATLTFQGQSGDGTWFNILGYTPGGAIVAGSLAANNAIVMPCGGYQQVRIIATAYASGTATITWNSSTGVNGLQVFNTIASSLLTSSRTQDGAGNAITSVLSGSDRYLEVAAIQDVNTSTLNSSTANLAAAATFTGTSESTLGVAALRVNFKSDQNFTIQVQQSTDGTNWDIVDSFTVLASNGEGRIFQATSAFFRILATNNGGSTTTFLRLQTELCPMVEAVPRALTASGNLKIEAQAATFGYYSAPVNIRQTAATAANATVWTIRNAVGSTKSVYVQTIYLMMSFDTGTPITRSLQRYQIQRFSTATPTAGTSIPIALMDSSDPVTVVTDARFLDTGLTTTSVVFDNPIVIISCPATDATTTQYTRLNAGIRLAPGEGLCIRLTVAAVVGQGLTGEIVWIEK